MNPKIQRQLVKDLSNHFVTKMYRIIEDSFVASKIAELDNETAMAIVMRNLLGLSAHYACQTEATKGQFLRTCSVIYDEMKENHE